LNRAGNGKTVSCIPFVLSGGKEKAFKLTENGIVPFSVVCGHQTAERGGNSAEMLEIQN
jgi:hypothetical protein